MTVWKHCLIDTYYSDGVDMHMPCEVRLDNAAIEICYKAGPDFARFIGKNDGTGHFQLEDSLVGARASLHMFPNSRYLEGYWVELDNRGMWRITLSDDPADEPADDLSSASRARVSKLATTRVTARDAVKPRTAREALPRAKPPPSKKTVKPKKAPHAKSRTASRGKSKPKSKRK